MTTFKATDGTLFDNRNDYRKYEMETQFTFRDRTDGKLVKLPGSVRGQPFEISDCSKCEIQVLDYCDQVQIDDVDNSKLFIGASSESIFTRNCKNCTFTMACKQLRVRDCDNCTFYLYCKTEPVIETSSNLKFANFNGAYPGHQEAMSNANLDPKCNLWFSVYDFSDTEKTGINWCYLEAEKEEPCWCPLRPDVNCCLRIEPGSTFKEEVKSAPFHHLRKGFVQFGEYFSTRVHSVFGSPIHRYNSKSSNDAVLDESNCNIDENINKRTNSFLSSWRIKIRTRYTKFTSLFKFSTTKQNKENIQEKRFSYIKKLCSKLKNVCSCFSNYRRKNQRPTNSCEDSSDNTSPEGIINESFEDYADTNSSKSSLTDNTKDTLNNLIDQGDWPEVVAFLCTNSKTRNVNTCLSTDT